MGYGGSPDRVARHVHAVDMCQNCSLVFGKNALLKFKAVLRGEASKEVSYRVLVQELLVGSYM
jgi:hypothetical protein